MEESRRAGAGLGDKQHAAPEAAQETGRGREAETPTQIPARGWKDILWRVYEEFGKDRVMSVAAGVMGTAAPEAHGSGAGLTDGSRSQPPDGVDAVGRAAAWPLFSR
jgi:hypothetical protein